MLRTGSLVDSTSVPTLNTPVSLTGREHCTTMTPELEAPPGACRRRLLGAIESGMLDEIESHRAALPPLNGAWPTDTCSVLKPWFSIESMPCTVLEVVRVKANCVPLTQNDGARYTLATALTETLYALLHCACTMRPLLAAVAVNEYWLLVAPGTSVAAMFTGSIACHCTVGVGTPTHATENVTLVPTSTPLIDTGCVTMTGDTAKCSVTTFEYVLPIAFKASTRYCQPSTVGAATLNEYVLLDEAPAAACQVAPPSALTCHWSDDNGGLACTFVAILTNVTPLGCVVTFGCCKETIGA